LHFDILIFLDLSLNINFFSHNCFLFPQFFAHVEEAEWAAEVLKSTGKPTAITLCIGPHGDKKNVSAGECAVRLARAGNVEQSSVAHINETGDGTGSRGQERTGSNNPAMLGNQTSH